MAYVCRFANQNLFDLLGRDPIKEPLTPFELRLFTKALQEILDAEFSAAPSTDD